MISNRRDLGGIKTMDGKVIRPGMLIRSAHLFQAEEKDLEGISAVIDLRTAAEKREAPDRTHGAEYLPLPIFDDATLGISHEGETENEVIPELAALYSRLILSCADSFRRVLLTILEHDFSTGAILWHCTEGKDRCGTTTALVLELLGVDRRTIMEDYLKTNEVNLPKAIRARERFMPQGKAFADSVYQAYIADEKYLRAAWNAMGDSYFREKLRLPEKQVERFRAMILMDC